MDDLEEQRLIDRVESLEQQMNIALRQLAQAARYIQRLTNVASGGWERVLTPRQASEFEREMVAHGFGPSVPVKAARKNGRRRRS